MKIIIKNAGILNSWTGVIQRGSVTVTGDTVSRVCYGEESDSYADKVIDADGSLLIPGFVDVHTHGRCGFDFSSADESGLRRMAESYASDGVTTVFPTLASDTLGGLCDAAVRINSFRKSDAPFSSVFGGIHLEGRYINPVKRGAHNPELIVKPSSDELDVFMKSAGLPLHITAALELDDGSFANAAVKFGATLGLGHTAADYSETVGFIDRYGVSLTHTYNAMPGIHHRDGGPVIAAFRKKAFCELICDGHHVDREMVAFTYAQTGCERLVLVSDSMAATCMPDGDYSIAGTPAFVRYGIARTPDGALAGSTLRLPQAVENLADFTGAGLSDAVRCATVCPALEAGISDVCGIIGVGRRADMILCRPDETPGKVRLGMYAVISAGRIIDPMYK
ncbi:MAG: amidohydrolase family protein [Clostridia bacterium]|nr:amidohydrolase family protein [Clostridia bacterium]